ncbi:MAG: thiol:disulfide interchange protein DsbA/DsbL [Caldimonas sp.]
MNRRDFSSALLVSGASASLLFAGTGAQAQTPVPGEGREYSRIDPPQQPANPGKIEVLEFFTYACPHCAAFEPIIGPWARSLPADVAFRRVPVNFLFNAENFQRTYYSLETIGMVDQMQPKVFAAVHVDKLRLDKPEDIAALVAKNGGDPAKFLAAFKSFSVATSIARAKKMQADYKIESVPGVTIQGRYLTSPSQAGGGPQTLAVADALIDMVRKKG